MAGGACGKPGRRLSTFAPLITTQILPTPPWESILIEIRNDDAPGPALPVMTGQKRRAVLATLAFDLIIEGPRRRSRPGGITAEVTRERIMEC